MEYSAIPLIPVFSFSLPTLLYYCYTPTRSKGYRAPGAIPSSTGSWAAVWPAVYEWAPESISRSSNIFIFIMYFFCIPTLLFTAFNMLVIRLLPTSNARLYGARRVRILATCTSMTRTG